LLRSERWTDEEAREEYKDREKRKRMEGVRNAVETNYTAIAAQVTKRVKIG